MFRFLLALLLVNTSSRSFVSPLPTKVSDGSLLPDLFVALTAKCNDSFLIAQITSKLEDCSIPLSPFHEKQFECLTFYDINKQLCDAVSTSKLMLTPIDTAKLNESVNIDKLCSMAKHWNVSNIVQFPSYKNTIEQIFNSEVTCVKVCGVTDILSQDSNAYCKYFKWGTEMLSGPTSAAGANGDIYIPSVETSQRSNSLQPVAINNVIPIVSPGNITSNLSRLSELGTAKTIGVKPEEAAIIDGARPVVSIQTWAPNRVAPSPGTTNVSEKNPLEPNNSVANVAQGEPIETPLNLDTADGGMEKPSAAEVQPPKKDDVANLEDVAKNQSADKESSLGNEKSKSPESQNVDPDDYQVDSDLDGKDLTLADMQGGDDGDDPMLSDPDIKQDLNLPKKSTKKIESMVSYNNGEMELFPNAMQEGFSDDDGHFFPFFLTAVILVVLLYVLYHNKNKVSKVVMGLIVEGRQSGRRRNSRGHAYRRLDTLEQAMSANTAAPPSKIIY